MTAISFKDRLQQKFFTPVSGLSLGVFRIMFGLLVLWDAILELFYGEADIYEKYVRPDFHFKHTVFEWVAGWPELWMAYVHFGALVLASFCVMIGLYYRVAIVATVLLVAYIFFIDMAYYLNHYYLVIVTGILMAFLPMNRVLSIDSLRHPEWNDGHVPKWSVWAMRTKVEIVLIYAGLVKLNPDWLRLEPLRLWLRDLSGWHIFGNLVYHDWFIAIGAYGTIALHLIGAPLLLFRRTRLVTFFVYTAFHLSNSYTFDIGIFPFLTIFATLIFFSPDWPKQFWEWLIVKKDAIKARYADRPAPSPKKIARYQSFALGAVVMFLIAQAVLPLRPLLYPGPVAWTQEGHQFSWRMKLRSMRTTDIEYRIYSPSEKREWIINPREYLTIKQFRTVGGNPEYILQFAHYLERIWHDNGHKDVQIYARVWNSLNGRRPVPYTDDRVDLTKEEWGLAPETWILPLNEPLRRPPEQKE